MKLQDLLETSYQWEPDAEHDLIMRLSLSADDLKDKSKILKAIIRQGTEYAASDPEDSTGTIRMFLTEMLSDIAEAYPMHLAWFEVNLRREFPYISF